MLDRIKAKVYVNKNEAEGAKKVSGLSDSDLVKVEAGDVFKVGESRSQVYPYARPYAGVAMLSGRGQPDLGRYAVRQFVRAG